MDSHIYSVARFEVGELQMTTADGDELKLQPEEDGERWKVTDGPDDLIGHAFKFRG